VLGKVYKHMKVSQLTDFQGDKSNHIPVLHIPQLYYFIASTTFFGWPVLISGPDGFLDLTRGVLGGMFGNRR
jgi:alpha-1,2-glucosyltransferase